MNTPVKTVFIIGPTATGKTSLGIRLAHRFNGEIVSADSRQVYRGLDIGTGKDLEDYHSVTPPIPHHLIDVADPNDEYNLYRFFDDAQRAIAAIHARNRLPLVVGGTPLYVKALLENYALDGGPPNPDLREQLKHLTREHLIDRLRRLDPDRLETTDLTQRPRIIRAIEVANSTAERQAPAPAGTPTPQTRNIRPLLIAPYYPRKTVHERIEHRLDHRLNHGMIEEVDTLHRNGVSWERLEYLGLEYRFVARFLQGKLTRDELRDQLFIRIRQFCKAQDVWHRRFERDGWPIHWVPEGHLDSAAALVDAFIANDHIPEPKIKLNDITYGPRTQ